MNRIVSGYRLLLAGLALLAAGPVLAHPHVWITAKAELVYAPDGRVAAVRHHWAFDPAYSAFVTQGLDKGPDGQPTAQALEPLAKENTDSLAEFDYFTLLKADGTKQAFDPPREPAMTIEDGQAVLSFLLPLKAPVAAKRALVFEVFDPTYFVSFAMADGDDAVRLSGAPKGCAATLKRPKTLQASKDQPLSESFFQALTASSEFGAQFSNRVLVACP